MVICLSPAFLAATSFSQIFIKREAVDVSFLPTEALATLWGPIHLVAFDLNILMGPKNDAFMGCLSFFLIVRMGVINSLLPLSISQVDMELGNSVQKAKAKT